MIVRQVVITDYAAEGKSLAKVDGKVIFISGAVPGDVADIRLTKNKKDWAEGVPVFFHAYSPARTEPFCRHFGICGGCKWQMLPYEQQLAYKQREVEENLRRIGKVDLPPVRPILGAAETRHYRNKLEFTFSNRKYYTKEEFERTDRPEQEPALGFHIPKWFDKVIDIEECHLMAEPSNVIRNTVRGIAMGRGYTFYDIRRHEGWLRNLVIRNTRSGETMVNLVTAYEDRERTAELCGELLEKVPQISTIVYTVNPKMNDSIHDLEPELFYGKGYITETLEDFRFKIGPKSFFQTNSMQGELLYRVARDFAGLNGSETVYDLYCGTGSIGIFMSKLAGKVVGVEVIREAVEDARVNASINGVDKASFFHGDVTEICTEEFFGGQGRPDVVVTDPPRAGMTEKLVRTLLQIGAPTLVYVSCNPATQARDLQWLDERYRVTEIQPVDMFPHTHHIENVVQLKLR